MTNPGVNIALGLLESACDYQTARQQYDTAERCGATDLELLRSWAAWQRNTAPWQVTSNKWTCVRCGGTWIRDLQPLTEWETRLRTVQHAHGLRCAKGIR